MENSTEELKKVALDKVHEALGAKMVPFAGFNMPVRYSSDIEEHKIVREAVGVFDVSHMGEFMVEGEDAEPFIQSLISNDVTKLFDGKIQYACLVNAEAGIVDDLLVYRYSATKYLLVVNASNIAKDWNWIESHQASFNVTLSNISDHLSLLAVQGPKAVAVVQELTGTKVDEMEYYTFLTTTVAGVEDVIVSATGYTGAGGFELYVPNAQAEAVWNKLFEVGAAVGIQPIGLGARDTLRLEKGFCLYGNDIDDTTTPLEAGLGWVTKLDTTFTASDLLKQQKEVGTTRRLTGFEMVEKGIARQGYEIFSSEDQLIGKVTSGTISPMTGKAIGLAYFDKPFDKPGTEVFIQVRKKKIKAVVKKVPFV